MRGSKKLLLALVAAGVAVGSAVMAAEGDAKEAPKGGEGKHRGEWFKEMDADGNGTVSLAEFTAAREKRMQARKEKMGDKWDAERAAKMPSAEEQFKKMDTNGDGQLTREEFQAAHKERMAKHEEMKGKHEDKGSDKGTEKGE